MKLCLFVLSLGNDALNDKVIADFPLKCRNSDLDDNVNKDIFWFLTTILISRNMLVCQSLVCSRCYECVADCFWFHGAFKFFQMLWQRSIWQRDILCLYFKLQVTSVAGVTSARPTVVSLRTISASRNSARQRPKSALWGLVSVEIISRVINQRGWRLSCDNKFQEEFIKGSCHSSFILS